MKTVTISLLLSSVLLLTGCASKKYKDVSYLGLAASVDQPTLNIFTPKETTSDHPVLVFVHGGNWNSGDKKIYGFLGRNFAKKGITTVVVGYTLSPYANYNDMAIEVAKAVEWTKANIAQYNGNPNEIYLSGHSAGGHLVALVGTNPKYLKDRSIIKGIILNDAFGLDMKNYLEENEPAPGRNYLPVFTSNKKEWENGSPINFLDKNTPPIMVYVGDKTYESIKLGNKRFLDELHKYQPDVQPITLNKSHIPMMLQFVSPTNKRYQEIIDFMNRNDRPKTVSVATLPN